MKSESSIENNFTNHSKKYMDIEAWILKQDFFWRSDVANQFPNQEHLINDALSNLKKSEMIQCCEVRKGKRQYLVFKNVKL